MARENQRFLGEEEEGSLVFLILDWLDCLLE